MSEDMYAMLWRVWLWLLFEGALVICLLLLLLACIDAFFWLDLMVSSSSVILDFWWAEGCAGWMEVTWVVIIDETGKELRVFTICYLYVPSAVFVLFSTGSVFIVDILCNLLSCLSVFSVTITFFKGADDSFYVGCSTACDVTFSFFDWRVEEMVIDCFVRGWLLFSAFL
jgi:hypothetical protein